MDFSFFGDDSKGLLRLDPRTKLLLVVVGATMGFAGFGSSFALLFAIVLCAVLALCGRPWTALKGIVVFSVTLYLRSCVRSAPSSAPAVSIVVFMVCGAVLLAFPMVLSFLLLIRTTRISQFLSAFQAMRLPVKVIIPVAVLFRFLPAVQEEWNGISKAMAFRGITLNIGSILKAPFKMVEYTLIPLLFSSVSVMEEMAAAAMARGMDSEGRRTAYEEVKLRWFDYIVIAVFSAFAVCVVIENIV